MSHPRSRRWADGDAQEILEKQQPIVDNAVREALSRWLFPCNRIRKNMTPINLPFVHSETIGLVRSRDGRIVASKHSKKYGSFFRLLCK